MAGTTEREYQHRMLRVLVHIQQHLDEVLSLDDLARLAKFSPYHFHRVFSGMLGESVHKHVRRLRLERAANRLKHTNQPVTHVALEAGFESHEAFTRAFRLMFSIAPSHYRKEQRPLVYPDIESNVHYSPDAGALIFNPKPAGEALMEVTIEHVAPMRVAFMRHTGPYHEVGPTWQAFCAWAGHRGLLGPESKLFGLCHDDPEVTPPNHIRYDTCLVVDDTFEPEGDVGLQTVTGGDYAKVTHHGPYENLKNTYAALCGQWLPQSGRELRSAPGFEVYHNNPADTPPQDLVTDIFMPLEPA